MSIVYTDADLFEKITKTGIPHVQGDVLGLVLRPNIVSLMKGLSPGFEAVKFTLENLPMLTKSFIVCSQQAPKYGNVCVGTSIKLDLDIQRKLQSFVHNHLEEVSGVISNDGITVTFGDGDEAPKQPQQLNGISFHTHPKHLYLKHRTNVGWPSKRDTLLERHRHLICSVEGIYLISQQSSCSPPTKRGREFTFDQLDGVVRRCSWILLPWGKNWWIYL